MALLVFCGLSCLHEVSHCTVLHPRSFTPTFVPYHYPTWIFAYRQFPPDIYHNTACATNTQQTWRQEFLGSLSSTVERSSTRTAAAGTFLRFFQTIFENTPLWRLKRLVTLTTYRRYINECIYLSNTPRLSPPQIFSRDNSPFS